jgi:hypothetical protein
LICKMNLKKLIQNLTRTFCEGSAADFLTKWKNLILYMKK